MTLGKSNPQWNFTSSEKYEVNQTCNVSPTEVLSGRAAQCVPWTPTLSWWIGLWPLCQNSHWEKKNGLFTKGFWENRMAACKRTKLDPYLTLHGRINSERTEDWSVRPETVKLLQENIGGNVIQQWSRQWSCGFDSKSSDSNSRQRQTWLCLAVEKSFAQ